MSPDQKEGFPIRELLGEILTKRNTITLEQLNKALEVPKKENTYIGQILEKLGFLEERDVVVALVVQCNIPYIAIDKYEIDRGVLQLIPKDVALKYQVIPLDRVGDVLSVVMVDPMDVACKAELQRLTNYRITPFIATAAEIHKAIDHWYGKDS